MTTVPVRVSFVCSGNICRSPTAEVVFAALAAERGRADLVRADSAGTGAWHIGEDMDPRARRTLVHEGYDVRAHNAKQFQAEDFDSRDLVVALDSGHRHALWWLATQTDDVAAARAKIMLLRDFDPKLLEGEEPDVADPYYGGVSGFSDVLEQVRRSCEGLLDAIEQAADGGTELLQQTGKPPL